MKNKIYTHTTKFEELYKLGNVELKIGDGKLTINVKHLPGEEEMAKQSIKSCEEWAKNFFANSYGGK